LKVSKKIVEILSLILTVSLLLVMHGVCFDIFELNRWYSYALAIFAAFIQIVIIIKSHPSATRIYVLSGIYGCASIYKSIISIGMILPFTRYHVPPLWFVCNGLDVVLLTVSVVKIRRIRKSGLKN